MKKIVSLAAAAVTAASAAGGGFPAKAASFTHNEWTGRDGTVEVFAVNRTPASVNAVPFQSAETAAAAVWDYNARTESDYFQLLTGMGSDWELNVVQNAKEAEKFLSGGFMNPNYYADPSQGWKTVQLPKSWTCQDFDFPIYCNVIMPWQSKYDGYVPVPTAPTNYNPVGLYRKKFTLDKTMKTSGRRVYIQLDGVESAYYVYLNGKEVGYSEDTFSPHRFDVTDYLTDGENTLAVEVHKFCDGTWFEGQDMIYDGGIFRDVSLVSTNAVQISDYSVRTDLDDNYQNASLDVNVKITNITGNSLNGWTIQAQAFDEEGNDILSGASANITSLNSWSAGDFRISTKVTSPKLWSAEDPNLYALVLTLRDSSGKAQEIVSTQLGFREIGFTPTQVDNSYKVTTTRWQPITINGKRLILKGVNRHDTDPFNGKAVPQDVMREDIRLMKQNNINAIRTSHYSNDSYLYWLCNKYGMYVMGETNLECHALMNDKNNKAQFYKLAMDRTNTAFQRLKNNPAIVAWSIGNEMEYTDNPSSAGGMFRDMIWFFKKNDGTRPVHSEGQGNKMGVDMSSNMYPGSDNIKYNAGDGKMPYVMCEYDHAMGNSVGALKEYWDVIRSSDNMLGGFIWDWVDQSRAVSLSKVGGGWDYYSEPYARKNLYQGSSRGKFFGYGGDWGDVPNDNSFCENGIISPDRTEQPEVKEVRYQYQDFWFSANAQQLAEGKVSVYNENAFTDLSKFTVKWELLKNGIAIDSGIIKNASCAPRSRAELTVPFTKPENCLAGDDLALNISVLTKDATDLIPAETEVSYEQFDLGTGSRQVKFDHGTFGLDIVDTPDAYVAVGKDFSLSVSKSDGIIRSYSYKGTTLAEQGPRPNFWRGYVENDNNSGKYKLFDTAWEKAADKINVSGINISDGSEGRKIVKADLILPNAGNTKVTMTYTIAPDGSVKVDMSVDATKSGLGNFLRVGSMMTLPEGTEQLYWYGNGPEETFNDRKTCGRMGVWENTVSGMFYPYMKADDCGNLTDVKWIAALDKSAETGLLVAADGKIEASALHFVPQDLMKADHVYKLSPRKETILSLNYGSMGTGSATCGQGTLEKYRLPSNRVYNWSFTLMPTDASMNGSQLSNLAARLRSDGTAIQDKSHNNISVPVTADASLKNNGGENCISGKLSVPQNTNLTNAVQGKNSFTVEVNVVPTGDPEFNMFAGKGDNAFALRTRHNSLDFFIHAGGQWRSLYCEMSTGSDWIGKKHQVAGIYDADKNIISVYCDGKLLGTKETGTDGGVTTSSYNFTIGACPDTGRSSSADFYEVRVYSKALTAAELASQNTASPSYVPDNKYVQLWLDFDNLADSAPAGDINTDGAVDAKDLQMLESYLLGKSSFTKAEFEAGDLDGDGKVNTFDLIGLRELI